MKKVFSIILFAILPVFSFAAAVSMNLSDAIKKNFVTIEAVCIKGDYIGKSLKLTITNTGDATLDLKIDAGIILKPANPAFQQLILAGEETMKLKSGAKGNIDVEVFCGSAPKACPLVTLPYSFLRMGSDTLMKVLRFIKDNSLYDQLGQAAVWTVTNHHPLGAIYDSMRESVSQQLISVTALATGRELPTYYAVNVPNETAAQPAYTAKTLKVYVPLDITLTAADSLTAAVYNSSGQFVKKLWQTKFFEQGKHSFMVSCDRKGLVPGKYSIRITNAKTTLKEKGIQVD